MPRAKSKKAKARIATVTKRKKIPKSSKTKRTKINIAKKVKAAKNVIRKTPTPKKSIKKTKRAKLTKPQQQKQRNFKKGVSILKKFGIAFRHSKNTKQSKQNEKKLKKFSEIISGKAKAYKVKDKDAKAYKKAGYIIKDGFLILPKEKGVSIQEKEGRIWKKEKLGTGSIERVILPIEYKNLRQYLKELEKDKALVALKKKGGRFAFRFFGNNSLSTFENLEQMAEYLGYYETLQDAIKSGKAKEQAEVYRNIEVVLVKTLNTWRKDRISREKVTGGYKKYRRNPKRAYRDRIRYERMKERNPGRYQAMLERKNARAKARYHRLNRDSKYRG